MIRLYAGNPFGCVDTLEGRSSRIEFGARGVVRIPVAKVGAIPFYPERIYQLRGAAEDSTSL